MPFVTIEGEKVEVDAGDLEFKEDESLPDGILRQSEVNGIVKSRLKRQKKSIKDELRNDDEFVSSLKQDDSNEELRSKASMVDDLKDKLKTQQKFVEDARYTQLENQLLKSVDPVDDMQDVLMEYAKSKMTYDEEYGWVQSDGDGIKYESGEPVTVDRFANTIKQEKPSFFGGAPANEGPDVTSSDEGSGKRTYTEAEWTEKMKDKSISNEEYDKLKNALADGRVI